VTPKTSSRNSPSTASALHLKVYHPGSRSRDCRLAISYPFESLGSFSRIAVENQLVSASPETSYSLQRQAEAREAADSRLPSVVAAPGSIDNIRHVRMLEMLAVPLAKLSPGRSWLTIGDGHYGSDAIRLGKYGIEVHATSLTDATLQESQKRGWIASYSAQNAEALEFTDNSFDYVLCKEAYHHFPRPPIALYEMLRVARIAVVLIEPHARTVSPLGFLRSLVKRLTGRVVMSEYEPSGNYIYRLRLTEITDQARALDLPAIAYRYYNDFFHPRFFRRPSATNAERILFSIGLGIQNLLSRLYLMPAGGITCAVFKEPPSPELATGLRSLGIKLENLPRNPYIAAP